MIFLSMRGETELALIDEAAIADERADPADDDRRRSPRSRSSTSGRRPRRQVVNPPIAAAPLDPREHPPRPRPVPRAEHDRQQGRLHRRATARRRWATARASSTQEVFNDVVFGGDPSDDARAAGQVRATRSEELWKNSLDDWGNPLRPANLNRGVYKGGRRPIDLYWRIAKGINGAKMPAHFPTLEPEQIWDLVNFVPRPALRARSLLEGATPRPAAANLTPRPSLDARRIARHAVRQSPTSADGR